MFADGLERASAPRGRRSVFELFLWVVGAFAILSLGGIWWVSSSLGGYELPKLVRPSAVVEGSTHPARGATASILVRVVVSEAAVAAAAGQDGRVFFELDIAGAHRQLDIGVVRIGASSEVVRRGPLQPGADVRWTIACPPGDACEASFEVTFAQASNTQTPINWRLSAEVRPARSTEVRDGATIELEVDQEST